MVQKKMIAILGVACMIVMGCCMFLINKKEVDHAVFKEEKAILKMTHEEDKVEVAIKPFKVNAEKSLEYYDGKDHEIDSITKFEGVYRSNQGIDYTFQDQAFEVVASLSGVVSDIKDDSIFGKSITITTNQIKVTYQSLSKINVALNEEVKQGMVIGNAGENIYHKQLQNHLHYVVTIKDKIINPESIWQKSYEEIVK